VLGPAPLTVPPLREINHHIPLIDPTARYSVNRPRCAFALKDLFSIKVNRYREAGVWIDAHGPNAAPM
jgi:hypothetical protein